MKYKDSGVDTQKAHTLIDYIGKKSGIDTSSFAGLFPIDLKKYKQPVLVTSTDGVGTKLLLAKEFDIFYGIAQDLFAMVINDIITTGAEPVFFLDYIASNKIEPQKYTEIISSLIELCKKYDVALLGGETAEMPGFYSSNGVYDLVGFGVGIVERDNLIDGSKIKEGDAIFALNSSGVHSNGFSLIRSALTKEKLSELRDEIMKPTSIYSKFVIELMKIVDIHGLAHITGGGLPENILRLLPTELCVNINLSGYDIPGVFWNIMRHGNIPIDEMFSVFNMGFGFVVISDETNYETIKKTAEKHSFQLYKIGKIEAGPRKMWIKLDNSVLEYKI